MEYTQVVQMRKLSLTKEGFAQMNQTLILDTRMCMSGGGNHTQKRSIFKWLVDQFSHLIVALRIQDR